MNLEQEIITYLEHAQGYAQKDNIIRFMYIMEGVEQKDTIACLNKLFAERKVIVLGSKIYLPID